MDYATLQSRVLARVAADSNDPLATYVDEWINDGIDYLETAGSDGWPWARQTITMTSTVSAYTFTQLATLTNNSTPVSKVLSVTVNAGTYWQPVELRSQSEVDQLYPSTSDTGIPEAFTVDGNVITFYPSPDAGRSTRFRVVATEPDLSASGSSPVMPAVFHGAIVDAALMFYYTALQDTDRADWYENRVTRWIDRMRRYGQPAEQSPRVRVREWL